jgi:S-formylglutathione hydrolase
MKKMKILCTTLPALGSVAIFLTGCHTAQLPEIDHPRLASGVALQDVTFYSAALKRQMPYRVFLPTKIDPGQKLPVVYLLYGGNGNFRNWSNYSDVAQHAAPDRTGGLILVMPEGGALSYYQNAALKPDDKYQDFLVGDLIRDVETRFPVAKGREHRAIMGISMGGFAAIKLALARQELFTFAGAISPAIDVCERKFNVFDVGQWRRLRDIFGPVGSSTRQAADPFLLVQSASPAATPYLYLTAGDQEPLLDPIRRFAARLREHGFSYEFHTKPGGHDWDEWDSQLPGCFESLLLHIEPAR